MTRRWDRLLTICPEISDAPLISLAGHADVRDAACNSEAADQVFRPIALSNVAHARSRGLSAGGLKGSRLPRIRVVSALRALRRDHQPIRHGGFRLREQAAPDRARTVGDLELAWKNHALATSRVARVGSKIGSGKQERRRKPSQPSAKICRRMFGPGCTVLMGMTGGE